MGISVRADKLSAYRHVVQDTADASTVPLLYPHAFLGSAHLMIICHKQFPLGALGLLHVRNHTIRYRPFGSEKPWDLTCELNRQRHVEKGLEFDFDATVSIDGEVVWRSVSTYLKRGTPSGEIENSPLANLFPALDEDSPNSAQFAVPSNIGKQFAKVTGDYNPIHVSSLAAKLFGFNRAIAHGMWSVARIIPELPNIEGPVRHDVAFKGPMFVRSKDTLKNGDNGRFDLFCGANSRPVIVGLYRAAESGESLS
jgi:hypothetical protein